MQLIFQPPEQQLVRIQMFLNIRCLDSQWCWCLTQGVNPKMATTFLLFK